MTIKILTVGFLQVVVGVGVSLWCAPGARAAEPPDTATVLDKLHQSDQKEIAAGKVAKKAAPPDR